ncbi:MAG: hypothetical protein ACE5FD_03725 [Anaerolineae bacterium]
MNLSEILADSHALEEGILAFERKYGVRSETFLPVIIQEIDARIKGDK